MSTLPGVMPSVSHDEGARERFVHGLRFHVTNRVQPGIRDLYARRVAPAFRRQHGRPPADRHEVRRALTGEPLHQAFSALMRTTQELMWDGIGESVARQAPELAARCAAVRAPGSLRLDPGLALPRYLTAVDFHAMPGSYQGETAPGDVSAGAVYDRGVHVYYMGGLGPNNDAYAASFARWLKTRWPDFVPRRILDIGCSVGHSTLAWMDAFPAAEVHGLDLAAPMLRYAHARAAGLGKALHLSQQNGEATDFPDGYFDLVLSHIVLHELPRGAIRNVFREGRRLLAPGGIMLHLDGSAYGSKDALAQHLQDWNTHYNNEPFQGPSRDANCRALLAAAGFAPDEILVEEVPLQAGREQMTRAARGLQSGRGLLLSVQGGVLGAGREAKP